MTTDALVTAIQRRLTDISDQQHALAVEKARLLEQLTPLRLGILAPATAVAELKAKGVESCVDCRQPHRPTGVGAPQR